MNMNRRMTAVLTALCMLFAPEAPVIPKMINAVTAHAEEATAQQIIDSGTCGKNVTWTLDDDGLLTISGTGEMLFDGNTATSKSSYNIPWRNYSVLIKSIIIERKRCSKYRLPSF